MGTLNTDKPVKTVGSYWPYATTLFDYIRRAMPLNAPQSLSNDDVYAVSGYVLYMNGLLPENATVDGRDARTGSSSIGPKANAPATANRTATPFQPRIRR